MQNNTKENTTMKDIAMLISDRNNEYFDQLTKVIENIIQPNNYNLFHFNTMAEQQTEENHLRLMMEQQVDGFIINSTGHNDELIAHLSRKTPTVLLHRRNRSAGFTGDFLDADFGTTTYNLCCHLIQNGHRRIGMICGPTYLSSYQERFINVLRALKTINVNMDKNSPYFFEGPLTQEFGYQSCKALLSLDQPPTALVIAHSHTTIGVLRYCREHSIRIPQDISFVSPCDVQLADILYVKPTCARPDTALGQRCGEMLMERIQAHNKLINREGLYSPEICYGESVMDLTT